MSSSFITPSNQRQRVSMTSNPKTGKNIPYTPFPNPRIPKEMTISKTRRINPYGVNQPHHSKD